jgi:hypothetical protein
LQARAKEMPVSIYVAVILWLKCVILKYEQPFCIALKYFGNIILKGH